MGTTCLRTRSEEEREARRKKAEKRHKERLTAIKSKVRRKK